MSSIRALCLWICESWNSESNTMWDSLKWCATCTYIYIYIYKPTLPQCMVEMTRCTVWSHTCCPQCVVLWILNLSKINVQDCMLRNQMLSASLCICTLVWRFHRSNQEILWTCSPNSNIPDRVFWSLTFSTMSLRIPWRDRVIWSIAPMAELYTTKNRQ